MAASDETDTSASRESDMSSVPLPSLAKEAGDFFKESKFDDCLSLLRAIQKRKSDDPKVLHNIAIAEYCREGCTEPEKLLRVLSKVKTRTSELKRTSEEQGNDEESTLNSSAGSAVGSSAGISGLVASLTGSSSPSFLWSEDYDTAIAAVNTGIVHYHLQQYASATSLLEAIYSNIEPIDESAAFWVCLLLLDMKLATQQVDKAATILAYVEKAFGYLLSSGDSSTSASTPSTPSIQASGNFSGEQASASGNSSGQLAEGPSVASFGTGDDELSRTALEEGFDDEALKLTLELQGGDQAGGLGRGGSGSGGGRGASSKRGDSVSKALPGSVLEVKQLVHMYKARLLLLTRNVKAAKREVKAAGNVLHEGVQTVFLLKAYLEYRCENYRKCIKVLTSNIPSAMNGSDTAMCSHLTAMTLSNLGCVHHRLGKPHLASLYFSKALKSAAATVAQKPLKVTVFSMDRSLSILYNAGLQQLLHGNALLAARCFQKCTPLFYNRPLLWLRLAECCFLAYERGQLNDTPQGQQRSLKRDDQVLVVVGGGRWRHVVLPAGGLQGRGGGKGISMSVESSDSETQTKTSGSVGTRGAETSSSLFAPSKGQAVELGVTTRKGDFIEPSLDYGRRCLRNALHLLEKEDTAAVAATAAAAAASASEGKDEGSPLTELTSSGTGVQSELTAVTTTNSDSRTSGGDSAGTATNIGGDSHSVDRDGKAPGASTLATNIVALEAEKSHQRMMRRVWAMACLAYIELCLNNPLASLAVAQRLLELPNCPPSYCFLARSYAAEALCLLDRPTEAAEHLSTCMVEHADNELPSLNLKEEGERTWRSGNQSDASGDGEEGGGNTMGISATVPDLKHLSGPTARASLYVNLAAVHAMAGEILQAHQCALQALSIAPANPLSMLSVVYVELCRGRTGDALAMLKHCRHICVGHVSRGQVVVGH